MIELATHFRNDDRNRHSEWLRQRKWFIKAKQDQTRREDAAEKLVDDLTALAVEAVIATDLQIRQFETRLANYESKLDQYDAKLDIYDETVTRALIEHLERLQILETRHAELLDNAFVLENGTKVFKSKDGTFVVDEVGGKLSLDIVDPDIIPDGFTTAEDLTASLDAMETENAEINELHRAQAEIDAAREQSSLAREKLDAAKDALDKHGITVQEIEDLDADLEGLVPTKLPSLPKSAIKHLSGISNAGKLPDAQSAFVANANPADQKEAAPLGRSQPMPVHDPMGQ